MHSTPLTSHIYEPSQLILFPKTKKEIMLKMFGFALHAKIKLKLTTTKKIVH